MDRKEFVVYAQKFQGNGWFPVDRFRRFDGKWFRAVEKESNGRKEWREHECFPDKEEEFKDRYYLYVLRNNYVRFSKKEHFGSNELFESDYTIEEIEKEINN